MKYKFNDFSPQEAWLISRVDFQVKDQPVDTYMVMELPYGTVTFETVEKEQGDFEGAIKAYETAIANYPPSDQYHLNETYNNLGTTFHAMGDLLQAKSAWEKGAALSSV